MSVTLKSGHTEEIVTWKLHLRQGLPQEALLSIFPCVAEAASEHRRRHPIAHIFEEHVAAAPVIRARTLWRHGLQFVATFHSPGARQGGPSITTGLGHRWPRPVPLPARCHLRRQRTLISEKQRRELVQGPRLQGSERSLLSLTTCMLPKLHRAANTPSACTTRCPSCLRCSLPKNRHRSSHVA